MMREWLMTNGIGGYASTSLTGSNDRRHHGLLVAAPPGLRERHMVLAQISEAVVSSGDYRSLLSFHTHDQYHRGEEFLRTFTWDGMPHWHYRIGDLSLEKHVILVHGRNIVAVTYRVRNGREPVVLHLTPLVNFRNHHFLSYNQYAHFETETDGRSASVRPFGTEDVIRIGCSAGQFVRRDRSWFYNMSYPQERMRGMPDTEDHFIPGSWEIPFTPGETGTVTLVAALDDQPEHLDGDAYIESERRRLAALPLQEPWRDPFVRDLALAADQFVIRIRDADVRRMIEPDAGFAAHADDHGDEGAVAIIAGYTWLSLWGRDSIIALPGLLLTTGRFREASRLLRSIAASITDGLLANPLLPDRKVISDSGADGPLWLYEAAWRYHAATGDAETIRDIMPVLEEIVRCHAVQGVQGVRLEADGYLQVTDAVEPRTWMNARVGNWVVTPRTGRPVELNALWYNALRILARFRNLTGTTDRDAALSGGLDDDGLADRIAGSFQGVFWHEPTRCLLDVAGDGQADAAVRPNQVLAFSLSFPVMSGDKARQAMDTVFHDLYVPLGLRSLSPADSRYRGQYAGDQYAREGAIHQGTVWPWLIGPFVTAWRRTHAGDPGCRAFLEEVFLPFRDHLAEGGLGSISQLAEGQYPWRLDGCIAQAWSVSEVLRAYVEDYLEDTAGSSAAKVEGR